MNCKLVTILGARNAPVSECEQGGAKCGRESILNKNSKVAPLPRFELLPPPLTQVVLCVYDSLNLIEPC